MKTRITELFGIEHPIIQAGMVWVSGAKLAAAVSNAGGLGLIGAGSMKPDLLREHIRKARSLTTKPFGVNIPLLRGDASDLIQATLEEGVRIVFTSAGHPGKFIDRLRSAVKPVSQPDLPSAGGADRLIVHVVANVKQAKKAHEVGCDAVVAEGFEAGGHNGVDELTTLVLVPQVVDAVPIPVIGAGGIADGRQMAAVMALGAEGVQVGTRFAATVESSAHENYKRSVVESGDSGTVLTLKKIAPVRMLRNPFAKRAQDAEARGASREDLVALLGTKRERAGIFEGDTVEGEMEAGQSAGLVQEILPAGEVVRRLMAECTDALQRASRMHR
jgi:enoyl-[acyl-carrier protein] reductase II